MGRKERIYDPNALSSESDSYKLSSSSAKWTASDTSVKFEGLKSEMSGRDEEFDLPPSRYPDDPNSPDSVEKPTFTASIESPDFPTYKSGERSISSEDEVDAV
jgi:hypothetical protein